MYRRGSSFQRCGTRLPPILRLCSTAAPPAPLPSAAEFAKIHAEKVAFYKIDTQTLANFLDLSVITRKGRVFGADRAVSRVEESMPFPVVDKKVYSLTGDAVSVPAGILASDNTANIVSSEKESASNSDTGNESKLGNPPSSASSHHVKLVAFSFKQYGFTLIRSWLDPFYEQFGKGPHAVVPSVELCFVEWGFLSFLRRLFIEDVKRRTDVENHRLTALVFGGINEFCAPLLVPNKFTGYVYLLDKDNRVRWKGCGIPHPHEVEYLVKACHDLIEEEKNIIEEKKKKEQQESDP